MALTELERTVVKWREKGLVWVEAKLKSDLLEKDKDSFLSSLMNDLRKQFPDDSDKRIESMAKGSQGYREYLKGMVLAKHAELKAKVEYDFVDKLFSARQSDQSMDRAKIEKNIYHEGGK